MTGKIYFNTCENINYPKDLTSTDDCYDHTGAAITDPNALSNAAFIFPSNVTDHKHHFTKEIEKGRPQTKSSATTICMKGGGLASAATYLSTARTNPHPVIGFPTQSGEPEVFDDQIRKNPWIAQVLFESMAQAWVFLGAGQDIILPVRKVIMDTKGNPKFFSAPIITINGTEFEPSFWGQNNPNPSPTVAQFYIECLKQFKEYSDRTTIPESLPKLNIPGSQEHYDKVLPPNKAIALGQNLPDRIASGRIMPRLTKKEHHALHSARGTGGKQTWVSQHTGISDRKINQVIGVSLLIGLVVGLSLLTIPLAPFACLGIGLACTISSFSIGLKVSKAPAPNDGIQTTKGAAASSEALKSSEKQPTPRGKSLNNRNENTTTPINNNNNRSK